MLVAYDRVLLGLPSITTEFGRVIVNGSIQTASQFGSRFESWRVHRISDPVFCRSVTLAGANTMNQQLKWQDVSSSNVEQIAHDETSKTLVVKFVGGGLYSYDGVDGEVFMTLATSISVGHYLNAVIKGSYPYLKHSDMNAVEDHIKARKAQP